MVGRIVDQLLAGHRQVLFDNWPEVEHNFVDPAEVASFIMHRLVVVDHPLDVLLIHRFRQLEEVLLAGPQGVNDLLDVVVDVADIGVDFTEWQTGLVRPTLSPHLGRRVLMVIVDKLVVLIDVG